MAWAELRRAAPAAVISCALGCAADKADSGAGADGPLVALAARAWRPEDAAATPFAEEAPADAYCSELAWDIYEGDFEVRSDFCLWGVYGQPLRADLAAGESLALTFTWGETWAAEPTTAELALQLGDEALWSASLPVPGPAGVTELRLPLTEAHAAGERAHLRISNHGLNSYQWSDVVVE